MFKTITDRLSWPRWAVQNERYKRLQTRTLLLDGQFYDHLPYGFQDEQDIARKYITVLNRRPSVRYNLLREVAVRTARKLWAGQHFPRLMHKNEAIVEASQALMEEGKLSLALLRATTLGSIGSACITFRVLDGRIVYDVWKPQDCDPVFDPYGDLLQLRIRYCVAGASLLARGMVIDYKNEPVRADESYWFVQDRTRVADTTYYPIVATDWDPTNPADAGKLKAIDGAQWTVTHNLGFVQAQWFENLPGGDFPDGTCTWESAIPIALHLDYTLSMLGRGLWYNSSPQVVLKGELLNQEEQGSSVFIKRGPANLLQVAADHKDESSSESGQDVKLLEMNGQWLKNAMEYVKEARQLALEAIQSSRKDPDNITGTMSGKAMELLEDDTVDLLMELRTTYGDYGFLPLLRHSLLAARAARHPDVPKGLRAAAVDDLAVQWPLPFQPDPVDLQNFSAALQIATGLGFIDLETAATMWRNYADVPVENGEPRGAPKPMLELIHGPQKEPATSGNGAGGR